jgi:two-component system sensor histidine kinase DesK
MAMTKRRPSRPPSLIRRDPDQDFAAHGPEARGFYPWLLLAGLPAWEIAGGGTHPLWAAICGILAEVVMYVWTVRWAFVDARKAERGPLPALAVLTITLAFWFQGGWLLLFPLLAIACGVTIKGMARGGAIFLGVAVVAAAVSLRGGSELGSVISLGWGTYTSGLVPAVILRLFEVIGQLRQTRDQLARTAVAEERLRFSRDLHDLLGHTLSVMVVKAEAVRRVLPADVAAASQQAADIERIGREALTEVRAAVTGYRGRGLTAELESARTVLGDAGVALTTRTPVVELPPEADALLGWAVREGVTNLIRHSGARACEIDLSVGDGGTVLEIRDDGRGGVPDARTGHGLQGLRERVTATGGLLDVADRPAGGFLLRVTMPQETR